MRERAQEAAVAQLRQELARGCEREDKCVVLFALHIGCGAVALGLNGAIEPSTDEVRDG